MSSFFVLTDLSINFVLLPSYFNKIALFIRVYFCRENIVKPNMALGSKNICVIQANEHI